MDCGPPVGSFVHVPGKNVGMDCHSPEDPFRGSSQPRDQTFVPALQEDSLMLSHQESPNLTSPTPLEVGVWFTV